MPNKLKIFLFLLFFPLISNSNDYNLYINNDGELCSVMVDFKNLESQLSRNVNSKNNFLRFNMLKAINSFDNQECLGVKSVEFYAIIVNEIDSYGQPEWGTVDIIGKYQANIVKIKSISIEQLEKIDWSELLIEK